MTHDNKNIMVILSSPSGVGKTTLTKKIQQKYQSFKISVSHTTRLPRSNEVDGVDYHFVSKKKFEHLIKDKEFYEYAKIFENYYGTLKKNVDETIIKNDLIFDPFAGSNTTGYVAEKNNRRWVSCDLDKEKKLSNKYVTMSSFRFDNYTKGPGWNGPKYNNWKNWN